MRQPFKKFILLTLSCSLAVQMALAPLGCENAALACGPFFDDTIFSHSIHPDSPCKLYASGQIGIVKRTYKESYLIAAYRYLSGKPLTTSEQAAYHWYWYDRFDGSGGDDSSAEGTWLKDRAKIAPWPDKSMAAIDVYRSVSPDDYQTYLNCQPAAFTTASATLAKLVSKYGADSPICKEWIKGQDAVFCHCHSPAYDYGAKKAADEPAFPEKLPDSALLELRQDRAYQMAAAYFYAQKLDDALSLFTSIAEEKTSPWKTIAQYMVARTLIRKGTLSKKDGFDHDSLSKALAVLKPLTSDSNFASLKEDIEALIDFVQLRIDPDKCRLALSRELSSPYNGNDLTGKIDGYIFVTAQPSNASDESGTDRFREIKSADRAVGSLLREDDLTGWILSFGTSGESALASAAEGFKMHHNLAWAVAYGSKLSGKEPQAAEVISVLAKVGKGDPGFLSASYYRARLLLGGKQIKEAEDVIAQALASPSMTPSAANDLSRLKLDLASTLEQFFSLSFRPPAAVNDGYSTDEALDSAAEKKNTFPKHTPVLLPESAMTINSTFPLTAIAAGATSKSIATSYTKQFAQAAFIRAVMLSDYAAALKMTPIMRRSYASAIKLISDFERASSPSDKDFAAVFLMLKCPGLRPTVTGGTGRGTAFDHIDDYQDNWWNEATLTASGDRGDCLGESPKEHALPTPFLSQAEKAAGKNELAKLKSLGEAPNYLGKNVIAYAKSHPSDPRVPEALALTVKATHLGSSDQSKTTAVSTQAFQILHKSYPGNQWTKKTPYHY